MTHLAGKTTTLMSKAAADRPAESDRLWRQFRNQHSEVLRETLRRMASGLERCMYCEDGQGTAVDHFKPRALDPSLTFAWTNHLLACAHCNSNEKRDQFPTADDGSPLLVDPTEDDPADHLLLTLLTGEFQPRTERGAASIQVFGLNRWICVRGRANAVHAVCALCVKYRAEREAGNEQRAERVLETLLDHPFASVRLDVIRAALHHPELLDDAEATEAVRLYAELRQ